MEYQLNVTQAELQIIYQGLGELQLKLSQNIFAKLYLQVQKQDIDKAVPLSSLVEV